MEFEHLFDRKIEFGQFHHKISKLTKELKEQQHSESFVEPDINQWMKQLEQLKSDLNRPLKFRTNAPNLQIKKVDWNDIIRISLAIETPSAVPFWLEKEDSYILPNICFVH